MMSGVGVVAVTLMGGLLLQDTFFRMAATPPGRFAAMPAPPRPDYAMPESWALRPTLPPPGGWEKPWGVDVFFIHPASAYAGDDWNADIADTAAATRLEQRILPNHAGPFEQAGTVYAPRYRQAALHSEMDVGGDGDGAFLVAYNDVLAAFDQYTASDNRERGIMLVGVGQGGLYAQRLLADRFQDEKMQERLAAAYIIDAALPADGLGKTFAQPVCDNLNAIHCIVAWKSIVGGEDAKRFRENSPVWSSDWKVEKTKGHDLVCVNPLTWTTSEELAPKADHRGGAKAVGAGDVAPQIIAKAVSARCRNGVLEVERPSAPQLQAGGDWGGRYKTPEYNIFYADIVANAVARANTLSAWLDENARKPAEPLPPASALGDAPIHRPGEPEPVPVEGNN